MAPPPSAVCATTTTAAAPAGAAIALVQLDARSAPELDRVLARSGIEPLRTGSVRLQVLPGGDRGLVARVNEKCAQLMPHGGPLVLERMWNELQSMGVVARRQEEADPLALYPEADDLVEACMLDALAWAASPLAIDTLFPQRDLWREAVRRGVFRRTDPDRDRILDRLLRPPTVVLVGRPNIGKSTLTNAMARRDVSIASSVSGTTLDHVGIDLNLGGLVVRWIDAPGFPNLLRGEIERDALRLARSVVAGADLVLMCCDRDHTPIGRSEAGIAPDTPALTVAVRADLTPAPDADVQTSAIQRVGLDGLATLVRDQLVPPAIRCGKGLWHFHSALPGPVE